MFSKFFATVNHIYSPIHKDTMPDTTIDVKCLFMKSAPLSVNWSFNVLNPQDSFTIIGRLQNVRSEVANPVSKPLMNVTTSGLLKDIRFTFHGNKNAGYGKFAIDYSGLKVDMYKADGKSKNKLLSFVGNILVKDDSDGELKKTDVKVSRKKDKSVFNFLWRFVQQGLKQTILPKIASIDN